MADGEIKTSSLKNYQIVEIYIKLNATRQMKAMTNIFYMMQ